MFEIFDELHRNKISHFDAFASAITRCTGKKVQAHNPFSVDEGGRPYASNYDWREKNLEAWLEGAKSLRHFLNFDLISSLVLLPACRSAVNTLDNNKEIPLGTETSPSLSSLRIVHTYPYIKSTQPRYQSRVFMYLFWFCDWSTRPFSNWKN